MSSKVVSDKVKNRAVPALAVHDAERALAFYAKAFGAKEVSERIPWEGKIGHAEIEIEGAHVMLADEFPTYNKSPRTLGGTPVIIHVDVKDVDSFFERALAARRCFNPSKMSHTEESASYKTHLGTCGVSTPHLINATELPRQAPPETPARADKAEEGDPHWQ